MKKGKTTTGLLRSGVVISMLAVLVSGVTFAALRSQNDVISGSHMTSASANLMISKQAEGLYSSSLTGYDFLDLEPDGPAGPQTGNDIFFRNYGSTNLDVKVSLNPARLSNPYGVDLRHTYLVIFDSNGVDQFDKFSLSSLIAAYNAGTPLPLNLVSGTHSDTHLIVRMQLDQEATDPQNQIEIQNLDFVFSGVTV